MKKKIICVSLMMVLLASSVSLSATKTHQVDDAEELSLDISVFGASMLTGLRRVGFSVHHQGGSPAAAFIQDIQLTFTVKSSVDDSIDFIYTNEIEEMAYNEGFQFFSNAIEGVGPVELTIMVTSSNAEDSSKTIKGFQIASFTLSHTFILSELLP